jgi:hypothetical protein
MKKYILLSILSICLMGCSSSTIKEGINKAGDVTGQATGEFVEGVTQGVKKAFDVKIDLPQNLTEQGIQFGKTTVSSDSMGNDNLLTVYIIFNKDYSGPLTAKAFDHNALEMGRVTQTITGKKNEAQYFEFRFDKRTNIDSNSKLTIE